MATSDPTASKVPDRTEEKFMSIGDLTKSDKMVKIYVGPEKECWVIHEDLICNKSKYFRSAFQGGFAESANKSIHIEDEDPKVFKFVVEWLYNGPLRCELRHESHHELYLLKWYQLSAMADKFEMKGLDAAAKAGHSHCQFNVDLGEICKPLLEEIRFVYENCPEISFARKAIRNRALQEYLCHYFKNYKYWGEMMACSSDFAQDMGREIKEHMEKEKKDCRLWYCSCHPLK